VLETSLRGEETPATYFKKNQMFLLAKENKKVDIHNKLIAHSVVGTPLEFFTEQRRIKKN
jgi:hypothetical protein